MQAANSRQMPGMPAVPWSQYREASLNWLALGLLLAAWNAASDGSEPQHPRPQALRGYEYVSVRALTRSAAD